MTDPTTQTSERDASPPLVWMAYDQAALDAAYDQSQYAPNQVHTKERREIMSRIVRERLRECEQIAYGRGANETFDLYRASAAKPPLVIFVHGGAWRSGCAHDFAFLAETFVHAGTHFAALDFDQIDACSGDLGRMADQVRRATAFILRSAPELGFDPARVYLIGHSSGAHLAGCILTADPNTEPGLQPGMLRGAMLCSGMYDLKPVRLSARSRYVAFTDAMEQELSPLRHLERISCPLILAHGTLETPEFQRQTRDFAAGLKAARKPAELIVAVGYNHFEILETLASPYGLLGHAALAMLAA